MSVSNVYQIGVRMTMHDNVSTALAAIAGHFIHLGHHIGHATAQARRFQAAVAGAALAYGGQQLGKAMVETLKHGAELLTIQNRMTTSGWTQVEIAEATAKAWQLTAKYQSIGVTEIVEMQKKMSPVLGDRHHAIEAAEKMTQLQVAMQAIMGAEGKEKFKQQIIDIIRAAELSGEAIDPKRFKAYLDSAVTVLNAFGGTVNPSDLFMATKYGRASALNWSDEFRERILPTIIQELGASSTGTAFMTMYSAIMGGRMQKKAISMFDQLGLIDRSKLDPTDLTPEGRIKRMKPGALIGSELFMENPYQFVQEHLIPALIKKGIVTPEGYQAIKDGNIKEGIGKDTRKAITAWMSVLFGDRTAQGMADLLALQPKKIERDYRLIGEAWNTEKTVDLFQKKDYKLALEAFSKQWDNLLTALTHPNLEKATAALKSMTDIVTSIGQMFAKSPEMAQTVGTAIVSVVVGAITVGLAILAGAVFGLAGAIAVAIVSVITFIGLTIMQNWETVKAMLATAFNFDTLKALFVERFGDGWVGVAVAISAAMNAALLGIPGMVASGIAAMASGIASAISAALAAIGSKITGFFTGKGGNPGPAGTPEGGMLQPQSFTPPARGMAPIQIRSEINMDGYRVAQAVTRHIVDDGSHVSGPATYDGVAAPTPVDLIEA